MKIMQPWFKVVKPNSFIESLGRQEDLLVADLGDVIAGTAHPIYLEPELFANSTYFTSGLITFLDSILAKISTGEGNSIIRLQTRFGGGKTHSLIAAHHLLNDQSIFRKHISPITLEHEPRIARIIGTHLNPIEGRRVKDIQIYTPWGELAYQLGGSESYAKVLENDQSRISPGKTVLLTLFSANNPTVILLDEITEFIAKARGVKVNDSNLGLQTLIFLQELTECIRSLNKSILVITLPEREYEITEGNDKPVLIEIDHILGRIDSLIVPSERSDLYQIIRKKLIKEIIDSEALIQIVDSYTEFYYQNRKEFPTFSVEKSYRSQLRDAYPFHPATIDLLFDKWNKLPTFQGTRTILHVLARTLFELDHANNNLLLIKPTDFLLLENSWKVLFYRHLPIKLTEVLKHEINIFETFIRLEHKPKNWLDLGKMIIFSIFLNSVPSLDDRGISLQEICLATWGPDKELVLILEIFSSLLQNQEYLHQRDNKNYISEDTNFNHKVTNLKNKVESDALIEIKNTLNSQKRNQSIEVYVWPKSSDEIRDSPNLKLILLSPALQDMDLKTWVKLKGDKFRKYQNTMLFSRLHSHNFHQLKELTQKKIAIKRIKDESKIEDLDKKSKLKLNSRKVELENGIEYFQNRIYLEFSDGNHNYFLHPPKHSNTSITRWMIQQLIENEVIVNKIHPLYIKDNFLKKDGKINTHSILNQFLKNIDFPKLLNRNILQDSLSKGIKENIFKFEVISDTKSDSSSPQETPMDYVISFTRNEIIRAPNQHLQSSVETDIKKDEKSQQIDKNRITLSFQSLDSKKIQQIKKGIVEPLETEEGDFKIDITFRISNPENLKNKLTLHLIKETVNQLEGEITEEE